MAWIKLETSVSRHRKFLEAGPAASWLWVCGLAYCQEGLTDGFIPFQAVRHLGIKSTNRLVSALVRAGLWEQCEGGWRVHDYLQHHKPAAEVLGLKQERRKNGAIGGRVSGERRRFTDKEPEPVEANPKQVASATAKQTANPDQITQIRSDQNKKRDSAEPPSDSTPVVLVFPTVGESKQWELRQSRIDALQVTFPNLDVPAQCRRAMQWATDNPSKRKTPRGMPAFLYRWMETATDRAGGRVVPLAATGTEGRGRTGAPARGKYDGIEEQD